MCEDAPELGRVAFDLDQGAAKLGLLLSLGQRLLEQATKAVLLPLDPQEILNLLPRTRAWDLRAQKRTTYDFSVREPDASARARRRATCSSPTRTPMKCRSPRTHR